MNFKTTAKIMVSWTLAIAFAGTPIFAATPKELAHPEITREAVEKMSPAERQVLEFKLSNREYPRAVVDGKLVTADDIRAETQRAAMALRREAKSAEEFAQKYNQLVAESLRRYTEMYLFVGEYEASGLQMPEEYFDTRINERIDRDFGGDRGKYLEYLRAIGSNPLADRQRLKNMTIEQNFNWQIQEGLPKEVSPMDVFRTYHQQLKNFTHPASFEYSQIVIYAGASQGDDAVAKAAKMLCENLKKHPENFAGTAKIHSRDEFRANGGYVGWKAREDLSEAVIETLDATKIGEVSDLLELTDGTGRRMFIIFKLNAKRDAGTTAINDVRPQLENMLRGNEMQKARAEQLEKLQERFFVEWF